MRWVLTLLVLGLLVLPATAATRLGLHVTQEELTIWRARMTDNVNGINGYTYQAIYQNRIRADANIFRSQAHPGGDGYWVGYTGAGCAPDMNNQGWAVGRANGARMMRSAFTYLLTTDVTYATPVFTELLNLTTVPGVNWFNQSKWCRTSSTGGGGNHLEMQGWMNRLVLTYDYLVTGGFTGWTPTQKTTILNWLHEMANAWDQGLIYGAQNNWAYGHVFDTPSSLACAGCPRGSMGILYFGGPALDGATYNFSNQGSGQMPLNMAVGLLTSDATLIDHAVKFFNGYIKAGTFDNGAMPDFIRWFDCNPTCPGSMWAHAAAPLGALVQAADMYARTGNTSLYTFLVPNVTVGQTGTTVSLRTTVKLWAAMANKTTLLYGTTQAGQIGPNTLLSWDTGTPDKGQYYDFVAMPANLFYNEATVHTAMTRNLLTVNDTWNGCYDAQYGGCFSGVTGGQWPDLPFMFGNMEGVVNPYTSGGVLNPPTNLRVVP